MFSRLLVESLRRGTRRKLLAVSAVTLGTLGATALGSVLLASGDRLAAEMGSYGANVAISPGPGVETLAEADLAKLRRIFWTNNIVAAAPFLPLRVSMRACGDFARRPGSAAGGAQTRPAGSDSCAPSSLDPGAAGAKSPQALIAPLVGTWFEREVEGWTTGLPRTRPTLAVEGRWPHDDEAEIVLGRRLAARLALEPGAELVAELPPRSVRLAVVGTVASGGPEEEQAFVPIAVVQGLAGRPGRYTSAEVFALTNPESGNLAERRDPAAMTPEEYDAWYCTPYPSSIAHQIGEALPDARVEVVYGITGATADVLGRLRLVLGALALVALAGAAVGVTAAMTATVLERRLEAGLLVAIGAPRGRVVLFFLTEAAVLGGLGGLAGGGLGLLAGRLLGGSVLGVEVPWTPVLIPFAALLGLAVAVAASLAPVLRALERWPAAILKRATA